MVRCRAIMHTGSRNQTVHLDLVPSTAVQRRLCRVSGVPVRLADWLALFYVSYLCLLLLFTIARVCSCEEAR